MASQPDETNGIPNQAINSESDSEGGSAPDAATPISSRSGSPCSSKSLTHSPNCDTPLPSIERGIATLELESVDHAAIPPPIHERSTSLVNIHLHQLRLDDRASATTDRRDALSPGPQGGNLSRSGSRGRSSSRNRQIHDVDQEEPPDSKFYSHDFQSALTQCKELARRLADALSSGHLHTDGNSAIHSLYSQAKDASRYSGPKDWKIGFVGDSGTGKSSLINSLLDTEDLARTSNNSRACTCTVTEYHYQDSPTYTIEITYFTKRRLLEQFKSQLQAYKQFHSAETATGRNSLGEGSRHLEEASRLAWDTFKAAFRNQPLLTEDYLQQQDEQTLLNNTSLWIDQSAPQVRSQAGVGQDHCRETMPDMQACSERLEQLTSDSDTAASWPYIERVKVFLRANILSKGLILVDLLGLRDTNSARKMITERYLVHCNEVFAIANIGRATTDAGVEAVIDLAKRTKRKHVGIVCTRSDEIRPEEAARDWTGPAQQTLKALNDEILVCETKLQSIQEKLANELNDAEELALYKAQTKLEKEKREHEYRRKRHMVTTRNNRVIDDLRKTYKTTVQHVFCTSKTTYWDHRNKDQHVALPWLQLSGIISLRRHCLGLVAEHQVQDASTFMKDLVPNLVSSINLWVQSGSGQIAAETRAQVREASKEVEFTLQRELGSVSSKSNKILSALDHEFDGRIRSQFTIENDEAWRDIAGKAAEDWTGVSIPPFEPAADADCSVEPLQVHRSRILPYLSDEIPASYAAFCRKDGEHTTGNIGSRCWNDEIIKGMIMDLVTPWRRFVRDTKNFFRRRSLTVERVFEQAVDPLRTIDLAVPDRANFDSVQTLLTTLLQRKSLLHTETLGIVAEYEKALSSLGNADFLSGIRTSFIGQHMEPAYQQAKLDSGTGVWLRRRALIDGKVKDPKLFSIIQQKLEAQFQTLTRDVEEKVQQANRKHLLAVRAALDTLRNENAVLEAEQNPAFRESMRKQVEDAQRPLRTIAAAVHAAG